MHKTVEFVRRATCLWTVFKPGCFCHPSNEPPWYERMILNVVLAGTHRTPYTAGKPTLSSLEPTEPPTLPENPYCRRSNPTEPTLSWVKENPRYRVATRVLKQSSVLKGQTFLREVCRSNSCMLSFVVSGLTRIGSASDNILFAIVQAPLTCVCCWVLFIKVTLTSILHLTYFIFSG